MSDFVLTCESAAMYSCDNIELTFAACDFERSLNFSLNDFHSEIIF